MVMISAGTAAGLSSELIILWVTSVYLIGGIFGILIPAYYRIPIPIASSLAAAVLFATAVSQVGLAESLGATIIAGIIVFLAGTTGSMGKIIELIPTPIVMAMVGGVFLSFGLDLVSSLESALLPAILMIGTFIIVTRFAPVVPPVLASIIVGVVYLLVSDVSFAGVEFSVEYPELVLPAFSFESFLIYGLPLILILIGMENPTAIALLKNEGFKDTPVNGISAINGFATAFGAFFGAYNTCTAGPMVGLFGSSEAGPKEKRWVGAILFGVIFIVAAPFYGSLVSLFEEMPGFFVAIIAGLALLKVLITTIGGSLGAETHKIGAMFAFLIAASEITILGIDSAFWALIIGFAISLLIEPQDFKFIGNKKQYNKHSA
ncbi:benzoate transporter [Salicibibacter kimchii]|uniref:Benzoate transporter n=1 Tax=Salicibibacter kimchii TaxID=2099786 RepID=A0A345C477_9BACI|nr:benzoate transporter [Salicibibacter kimchii]